MGSPRPDSFAALRHCLAGDLYRYQGARGLLAGIRVYVREPGFRFTFWLRVAAYFSRKRVLKPLGLIPRICRHGLEVKFGISIPVAAKIGPGLKIIHGVGAVIGAMCTVGSQFTIYQGATIGDKLGRDTGKRPVIGDQVIATVGSQILGPVTVGSKSVIAANAVVLESVPERCVAAGVPARVVVKDLSDEAFGEYWASIKG